MTWWAILAALVAAFCYAAGAAWQQRQAVAAPSERVVHPGLIWQLLRRPAWLAGFGVVLIGEVLHVLALAWAPVAVVQPVGVATVLFAVLVTAVLDRRRPRPAQLAAAALIVAALVRLLSHRISIDGVSGLFGWPSPLLAVTAIGGLLLEQDAYKSGHLGAAVAGTTITDPLVAVLVGAWVVHQPVQFAHPVVAYLSAAALVAGVALLARGTADPTAATVPARSSSRPAAGERTRSATPRERRRPAAGANWHCVSLPPPGNDPSACTSTTAAASEVTGW